MFSEIQRIAPEAYARPDDSMVGFTSTLPPEAVLPALRAVPNRAGLTAPITVLNPASEEPADPASPD